MKITKRQLRRIIKEEKARLLSEADTGMKITKRQLRRIIKEEVRFVMSENILDKIKSVFGGKPTEKSIKAVRQKMMTAGKAGNFEDYEKLSRTYLDAVAKLPDLFDAEGAKDTVYKLDQEYGFARKD